MAQSQFRNGSRAGAGGIANRNALAFGVGNIDVVHAHAAANDQLQPAFPGLVNMLCAHLGLGPDHHAVKFPQRPPQNFRFVELFYHFVTCFPQLCNCTAAHSVGNQNTHVAASVRFLGMWFICTDKYSLLHFRRNVKNGVSSSCYMFESVV